MPSSPNKGYTEPTYNSEIGTWGTDIVSNFISVVDLNVGGFVNVALSSTNVTLTTGSAGQIQNLIVNLTGTLLANVTVSCANAGFNIVENLTTGAFAVTWQANFGAGAVGTAWVIPQGYRGLFYSDTTNGARCLSWDPVILAAASGSTPVTIRRMETDTSTYKALSIQSGAGSGNDYALYETGDGSSNVATISEKIGSTLLGSISATARVYQIPLELVEIAKPTAPASGNMLLYAKSGDVVAAQTPAGTEYLIGAAPTVQQFTSGSGTYTPTTGTVLSKVSMIGPSGSSACASGAGNAASGNTVFGAWTAVAGAPGSSGTNGTGGAGGASGTEGTGTQIKRFGGGRGGDGAVGLAGSGIANIGGQGGVSALGGAAPATASYVQNNTGLSPTQNTGSGASGSTAYAGSGAGEYVEFYISNPSATSYSVGTGGTSSGTGSAAGSTGGIWIEEFYS